MENLIAAKIEKSLNLADLASQSLNWWILSVGLIMALKLARFYSD